MSDPIRYVQLNELSEGQVFLEYFNQWTQDQIPPHRHNYHELLWILDGEGEHSVDEQVQPIEPQTLWLIARGQVHHILRTQNLSGYMLAFNEGFLKPFQAGGSNYHILFNYSSRLCFPMTQPDQGLGEDLLKLMVGEYEFEGSYSAVLPHLVQGFLCLVKRMCSNQGELGGVEGSFYGGFIGLLEVHLHEHHDVAFYAKALHMTPSQLSRLMHKALGKSPKQVIQERLMLEAKRYLQFSDLSVKQIALELGFADPYHFSKVFKAAFDRSPQDYRRWWEKLT